MAGLVDFLTIYIAEAHPAERQHFSGNIYISTHETMEERVEAADTLREKAGGTLKGCPILVSCNGTMWWMPVTNIPRLTRWMTALILPLLPCQRGSMCSRMGRSPLR